eukprot:GHVU01177511.1.p1 GENE.GHVU01177511.1~~GHVU01177511.1.p1  ORF type:complete len:549 (-),score=61.93 GHVU01177511.1:326-1972(-)
MLLQRITFCGPAMLGVRHVGDVASRNLLSAAVVAASPRRIRATFGTYPRPVSQQQRGWVHRRRLIGVPPSVYRGASTWPHTRMCSHEMGAVRDVLSSSLSYSSPFHSPHGVRFTLLSAPLSAFTVGAALTAKGGAALGSSTDRLRCCSRRRFASSASSRGGADAARDFYSVLGGIQRSASQAEVKKAYRQQALAWHPDRHQKDRKLAEARFREIAEAYEVLSDPSKRREYDAAEQLRRAGGGPYSGGYDSSGPTAGPRGYAGSSPFPRSAGVGGFTVRHMTPEEAAELFASTFGELLGALGASRGANRNARAPGGAAPPPFFGRSSGSLGPDVLEDLLRSFGAPPGSSSSSTSTSSSSYYYGGSSEGGGGGGAAGGTVSVQRRVFQRGGRMIERTVQTWRSPDGRVHEQVAERELGGNGGSPHSYSPSSSSNTNSNGIHFGSGVGGPGRGGGGSASSPDSEGSSSSSNHNRQSSWGDANSQSRRSSGGGNAGPLTPITRVMQSIWKSDIVELFRRVALYAVAKFGTRMIASFLRRFTSVVVRRLFFRK